MRTLLLLALCFGCGAAPAPVEDSGPRSDAIRVYAQAEVLLRDGHLAEAAELYDRAASLDPTAVKVWLAGAGVRGRLHQWPQAITRAERAHALAPDDAEIADVLGLAYLSSQQFDRAKVVYAELAQSAPTDARAWVGLSRVAAAKGDDESAERYMTRAVRHDDGSVEYWHRLGVLRRKLHRPAAAAQALDRAARLAPGSDQFDRDIYRLALEGGDPNTATDAAVRLLGPEDGAMHVANKLASLADPVAAAGVLEGLLEEQPDRHDARLLLARIRLKYDLPEAVEAVAAQIPAGAPEWTEAQRILAWLDLRAGRSEASLAKLEAAWAAVPDDRQLLLDLTRRLQAMGQLSRARTLLSGAIERWPAEPDVRYQHGLVVQALGDEEGALKAMFGVLSVEPNHAGALNFIGYTWAVQGKRLADAEAYIRKALERQPDNAAIVDSLGWVLFKRGRIEQAEARLRQAVALAPDEGEIHFHLAEVLWAAGRRKEARKHYGMAVEKTQAGQEKKRYEARRRARR